MNEPLQENGKKKRMNKMERQAKKHSAAIDSYSFATHSQIRNGYVGGNDRKATDPAFCCVFITFIIGMIAMSIVGFTKGNYKALIAGVDSHGNICGYSENVANMPMTYYMVQRTGD